MSKLQKSKAVHQVAIYNETVVDSISKILENSTNMAFIEQCCRRLEVNTPDEARDKLQFLLLKVTHHLQVTENPHDLTRSSASITDRKCSYRFNNLEAPSTSSQSYIALEDTRDRFDNLVDYSPACKIPASLPGEGAVDITTADAYLMRQNNGICERVTFMPSVHHQPSKREGDNWDFQDVQDDNGDWNICKDYCCPSPGCSSTPVNPRLSFSGRKNKCLLAQSHESVPREDKAIQKFFNETCEVIRSLEPRDSDVSTEFSFLGGSWEQLNLSSLKNDSVSECSIHFSRPECLNESQLLCDLASTDDEASSQINLSRISQRSQVSSPIIYALPLDLSEKDSAKAMIDEALKQVSESLLADRCRNDDECGISASDSADLLMDLYKYSDETCDDAGCHSNGNKDSISIIEPDCPTSHVIYPAHLQVVCQSNTITSVADKISQVDEKPVGSENRVYGSNLNLSHPYNDDIVEVPVTSNQSQYSLLDILSVTSVDEMENEYDLAEYYIDEENEDEETDHEREAEIETDTSIEIITLSDT